MRTIGAAGRAERRRTVMTLRAKGWSYETIAQHTGLSRTGVFNICQRIQAKGRGAIEDPRWPVQIPPPVATPNSPRQDESDYDDSGLMAMRAAASLSR